MVKKKLYSVALALLILFGALCGTAVIYHAEASAVEDTPRVLYYFKCAREISQDEETKITEICTKIKNADLIDEFHVMTEELEHFSLGASDSNYFHDFMNPKDVAKQKAYLIFEFEGEPKPNHSMFFDYTFSEMKNAGCKIMFICARDENYFKQFNGFLDYVDIHINTDIYDTFLLNVVHKIYRHYGDSFQWDNLTLILNINMEQFLTDKIYPLLLKAYQKLFANDIEDILDEHDIKILIYDENRNFVDLNGKILDPESEELLEYFLNDHIFAIGANFGENEYDKAWQNAIAEIKETYGLNFAFFQYENDVREDSTIPTYLCHGANDISSIIVDFLCDYDLTQYDNWEGRCDITHKTVIYGVNGWMTQFGEGDDFFDFLCALWYEWEI